MRQNADKVIRFVLNKLEGGGKIVNHKSDPGRLTKWGFSQKWNSDIDVRTLDEEGAVKRAIERYWIEIVNPKSTAPATSVRQPEL